jgi:hypothetical protein
MRFRAFSARIAETLPIDRLNQSADVTINERRVFASRVARGRDDVIG